MKTFKLVIGLMLILTLLFSASAGTTYLNSCGKNSGWLDNEIYLLNFTDISGAYAQTYCFKFDAISVSNITIDGQNILIDMTNNPLVDFFEYNNQGEVLFSTFENLNIYYPVGSNADFTYIVGNAGFPTDNRLSNSEIKNSVIQNPENIFRLTAFGRGTDLNFNNVTFLYGTAFVNQVSNARWDTGILEDVFFKGDRVYQSSGILNRQEYLNSIIINNPSNAPDGSDLKTQSNINYTNTLISNYPHVDVNNDGIADTNIYLDIYNSRIFKDRFFLGTEYAFLQDMNEGAPFLTSARINAPIFPENISSLDINLGLNNVLDTSFAPHTYNIGISNTKLVSSGASIKCLLELTCDITTLGNPTTLSSTKFKPYISIASTDHILYGINFNRNGDGNGHIIANFDDTTKSDINISNNILSAEKGTIGVSQIESNHLIKLKANSIKMHNNDFNVFSLNASDVYEFLYIEASTPSSNKIYRNTFDNSITSPSQNSSIFTYKCDTDFYNNLIYNDVVISNDCTTNLNVTPDVGYLHTDGKLYIFSMGNYYEDNIGTCADLDTNGFCDSPYTSGIVTDNKPLSSYPFDFASNLLSADLVIDNLSFEISLTEPFNLEQFSLTSGTDIITFGFNHNADFTDLRCDYIIDGSIVSGASIIPASPLTTYNQNFNGWINKTYTYRVECYNDFSFEQSPEIDFNVTISGEVTPPEDELGDVGAGNTSGLITGVTIIGDTPEETVDNIKEFSQEIVNPFLNFGLIFLVLIALFSVIGLVVGLFTLI